MMISPESYEEMNLKGKSAEEIEIEISRLKEEMKALRRILKTPVWERVLIEPDESTQLSFCRQYLKRAEAAYQKAVFDAALPSITKVTLEIRGFFKGQEIRTVLLNGNEAQLTVEHPLEKDRGSEVGAPRYRTKDAFLEEFRKIGIEKWKKQVSDWTVLDGEHWELSIGYEDGRTVKYTGDNAYPSGFDRLCALMGRTGDEE